MLFFKRAASVTQVRRQSSCSKSQHFEDMAGRVALWRGKPRYTLDQNGTCLRSLFYSRVIKRNKSARTEKRKFVPRSRPSSLLDRIVRVDHAGEVGADRIYAGQMAVLGKSDVGHVIQEMWDQEKDHVNTFNKLIPKYRVRPTALMPVWNIAGYALGAGSALLGKEAAMACTIAVEEVIGEHYDNQLRELLNEDPEGNQEILDIIQKFRDDELEHLHTGVEHEGEKAPFYPAMKQIIQGGCKVAIWLSEKI